MKISLIAVGTRMPAWVETGFAEYAQRMRGDVTLSLVEVASQKRSKQANLQKIAEQEANKLLAAIPKGAYVVALDERGKQHSTQSLAQEMSGWMQNGQPLALLIGGPEGLAPQCLEVADARLSLSRLTFPHPLVRILIAEQLYRAWCVLRGHPYHRE